MKALVLAAENENRFKSHTSKCMVDVNGHPLIDYVLDGIVDTDINEILIVIGYRGDSIINHVGSRYKGKKVGYIYQNDPRGIVHAIDKASCCFDRGDFMLMLADEFMEAPRQKQMIKEFYESDSFVLCGICKVEDLELIKNNYTVEYGPKGNIFKLIEKPSEPFNNDLGTGVIIFNNSICNYIGETPINPIRKEKDLVDLIQCAINDHKKVKSFNICDHYFNINTPEDLQSLQAYLS
ncbi:MAG TPA: sugar phosphate nucleotidyltransferase [Methanofastidiosum sp.]|nr:sugar phosphate nucleotidyltransferase [Methanofastidiosum sp.]